MAIMSALMLKVRPGKEKDLLELLKTVKKAVERAGGTYAVHREVFGPATQQYCRDRGLSRLGSFVKSQVRPRTSEVNGQTQEHFRSGCGGGDERGIRGRRDLTGGQG